MPRISQAYVRTHELEAGCADTAASSCFGSNSVMPSRGGHKTPLYWLTWWSSPKHLHSYQWWRTSFSWPRVPAEERTSLSQVLSSSPAPLSPHSGAARDDTSQTFRGGGGWKTEAIAAFSHIICIEDTQVYSGGILCLRPSFTFFKLFFLAERLQKLASKWQFGLLGFSGF